MHILSLLPLAPGDSVNAIFTAGQTELAGAVPLVVTGVAAILGLSWVVRAVFIAQRVARKASNQIG